MIRKEKWEELRTRMALLEVREEDCIEKFVLGTGKGGQKVNKTASCVYLKHSPSGLEIKCQQERSRELNRFLARRLLCDKLEEKLTIKTTKQKERDKIRKQKKRRLKKHYQKAKNCSSSFR